MQAWMPGAIAVPSGHDAGSLVGGGRRACTWHTFEAPYSLTALDGARRLINAGNEVQLTFNPNSGQTAQMISGMRAGRALINAPGGVETNRYGDVHVQIEVIAYAHQPWTRDLTPEGTMGLRRIVTWLRSLGIPDDLPAGPPPAYPPGQGNRSIAAWARSGHFNHSQVPENYHGDSGAIDMGKILGLTASAPAATPPTQPAVLVVRQLQRAFHVGADGYWGPVTDKAARGFRAAAYVRAYPFGLAFVQQVVGTVPDGLMGPKTLAAITATTRAVQASIGVVSDGDWGPMTDQRFAVVRKANLKAGT